MSDLAGGAQGGGHTVSYSLIAEITYCPFGSVLLVRALARGDECTWGECSRWDFGGSFQRKNKLNRLAVL